MRLHKRQQAVEEGQLEGLDEADVQVQVLFKISMSLSWLSRWLWLFESHAVTPSWFAVWLKLVLLLVSFFSRPCRSRYFSQIPSTVERVGQDGSNQRSLLPGDEEEQFRLALQLSQRADEEERQRRQREEEELEMILALSLTEK